MRHKFSYDNTFMTLEESIIDDFFSAAVDTIEILDEIYDKSEDFLKDVDDVDSVFELLDFISEKESGIDEESIMSLIVPPISITPVLANRQALLNKDPLGNYDSLIKRIRSKMQEYLDFYSIVPDEDFTVFISNVRTFLGNFAYFVYFQYDLHFTEVANDSSEPVYKYCMKTGRDEVELAKSVWEKVLKYSPNIPIFEEYPELEEPFMDVASVYFSTFDIYETPLTLEDVQKIINMEVEPGDYLLKLQEKRGGVSNA